MISCNFRGLMILYSKEDYDKAKELLSEAAKSGSYVYPFKYVPYPGTCDTL